MSIAQNPLMGQMRKSMGNFSTYTLNGQNIVRSKAFNRRDANSEAQRAHRAGFKLLASEFQVLGFISEKGLLLRPEGISVYNRFFALNLPRAIDFTGKEPKINYNELTISEGPVARVRDAVAEVTAKGLKVRFDAGLKNPNACPTDVLYALLKTKSGDLVLETQPRGSELTGEILIDYPDLKQKEITYCYLFLTTADGTKASKTIYVPVEEQ